MADSSFYSAKELEALNFKSVGDNVFISRKASFYSAEKITIGSHVRIDDFCILSGRVEIKNYIHIAAHTCLYGADVGIFIDDFSNVSSRCAIYAISDDYSGNAMTNPLVPDNYKKVQEVAVYLEKHVIIGTGSTVLPGVTLAEGSAVGAMSLVKKNSAPWSIYAGIPVVYIKDREKNLLKFAKKLNLERGSS